MTLQRECSTTRRPRAKRTRTGQPIALTARDLELFAWLRRYRYLRSSYLHAFAGGRSEKRFKERLGDLFHEGFLERPEQQWDFADARCQPAIHEMGAGARRALLTCGEPIDDARTYLGAGAHRQFRHAVLTCDVVASMELAVRRGSNVRFIGWAEIRTRGSASTRSSALSLPIPGHEGMIVPDAMFGLEYGASGRKSYRFFALEIDRGTMPLARTDKSQTSLFSKLEAYRRIIAAGVHRAQLGVPNLIVLTLTTSEARLQSILDAPLAPHQALLFQCLTGPDSYRPNLGLYVEPWLRLGFSPLSIAS